MKSLLVCASIFLCTATAQAMTCPWKVKEMGGEIDRAVGRVAAARKFADRKDDEIATIRRDVILDCQGNQGRTRLDTFVATDTAFDIDQEVALAATLVVCVDEKRAEVRKRMDSARTSGNKTLERRLLQVASVIEELAPRLLDHDVSVNQLASKVERLNDERGNLLDTCEAAEF